MVFSLMSLQELILDNNSWEEKIVSKVLLKKIYDGQVTLKHPSFLVVNLWKNVSSVESQEFTQMRK